MVKLPYPRTLLGLFPILTLALSCTLGGPEADTADLISRDAFVQVYVQLRVAALSDPTENVPLDERDRILQEAGVTEEDLLRFVEVRGREVQFMRQLWEEVDSLIQEFRDPTDSST